MLTEQDIQLQRQYNKEALTINFYNELELPLDKPDELWDIIERAQKALITDNLALCLDCLLEIINSNDPNEAPIKTDGTYKQACEGFNCKNQAIFRCYFTNKL